MEGIHQPIAQHGIHQGKITHLLPSAQLLRVWRLGHAFLTARHYNARIASGDLLRRQRHGAQARTAKLIDAKGRVFHRNARIHGSLTRRVLPRTRGQNLAQNHLIHFRTFNAGAFHGGLDGGGAQRMRGQGGESPVEGANRRAGGGGDDDFGHWGCPSSRMGHLRLGITNRASSRARAATARFRPQCRRPCRYAPPAPYAA